MSGDIGSETPPPSIRENPQNPREQTPSRVVGEALAVANKPPSVMGRLRTAGRTVANAARAVAAEFNPNEPKMLPKEILPETVAYTIQKYIHNPAAGTYPGEIPFDITTVMTNAGYTKPWRNSDYHMAFPNEYQLFRQALNRLAVGGALTQDLMLETEHGETIRYRVAEDQRQKLLEQAMEAQKISSRFDPSFLTHREMGQAT